MLAADQNDVAMACVCDELGARHVTRRPWQLLSYARHRENALPGELRMRRSGLACDRCIPYMSASSEPPTVLVQCLQGPVPITRMCPSLACDYHRNKPAVPVLRREALPNSSLRCAGLQGRASEEILPLRRRSAAVDFRQARFRRLEVSCEAEKGLKCV